MMMPSQLSKTLSPEKTKPMSRRDVLAFLDTHWGLEVVMSNLYEKNSLSKIMLTFTRVYNVDPHDEYNDVMGALLHFWKTS